MQEFYKILGISPDASDEEVEVAYRSLKEKYSKERFYEGEAGNEAARKLTKVEMAYQEIMDSRKQKSTTEEGKEAQDFSEVQRAIKNGNIVGAHINENGEVTGGQTGDQTGKEISDRTYYNYPWTVVLRLPSTGGGGGTEPDNRPTPPIRNKDKKNYKFVLLDKRRRR
jgi:DnaJ-class molecular chaperone